MNLRTAAASLAALLVTVPALGKDYAVILSDIDKQVLLSLLDTAVKSQGLAVAQNALVLAGKINAAGEVVERKDALPKDAPPTPSEETPK